MPLVLIALSIALFFLFTNDQYTEMKELLVQKNEYTDSLDKYEELVNTTKGKSEEMNNISSADRNNLSKILPNNVDNIRLFLDIQNIAGRFSMGISDIAVGDNVRSNNSRTQPSAIGPTNSTSGSLTLSFSTVASYGNLIAFLKELEKSLRIVEIKSLSFETNPKSNNYQVDIALDTFWLRNADAVIIK